jgi:glucosamine 6-phosphate synthetase-like amidotransferase/phosphosugar isomerase protein
MVHAPAQAYPSLEIMHGPNYFLSENTLVTLLHAESISSRELPLLERLRPSGARRFVICENASPQIQQAAEFVFEIGSGLSEAARLVLAMPIMQLFAYYRARATGKALE